MLFAIDTGLAHPMGQQSFDQKSTTIINTDNQMILKVNLEDLPNDQKALIEQATEEFKEKYLLSYSRTHDSVVRRLPYQVFSCMVKVNTLKQGPPLIWSTRLSMKPSRTTTKCWPTRLATL
jgi:hypothetical protein